MAKAAALFLLPGVAASFSGLKMPIPFGRLNLLPRASKKAAALILLPSAAAPSFGLEKPKVFGRLNLLPRASKTRRR